MSMNAQEYRVGQSVVALRIGNILNTKTEVIVSSDDDYFTMSGGVSLAILQEGGADIRRDAQAQIARRELGDMIETGAGLLSFRRIYHVVSRFDGGERHFDLATTHACIQRAVDNCIEALARSAYTTIAFPAIGTGYAGHAPADVASSFAKALGTALAAEQKSLQVELYIHPDSLVGDATFIKFFHAFENKADWLANPVRSHAIAMIHGIRTDARWHDQVGSWLRKADPSINPVPIGYGFFDVFSFLLPSSSIRRGLIGRVEAELNELYETKSTQHLSIIAHSFGTFLVAFALLRCTNVKVHRLILCGSIVPRTFPWAKLRERLEVIDAANFPQVHVINDCGWRDIWPVLAHSITFGYGPSGRFGFQTALDKDRTHDLAHSDFFTEQFVTDFWLPALVDSRIVPNNVSPPPSAWILQLLTRFHLKVLVPVFAAVAWFVARRL